MLTVDIFALFCVSGITTYQTEGRRNILTFVSFTIKFNGECDEIVPSNRIIPKI
ncbi:hypothetical protein SAMN06265339_0151 [Desulfurobacterium pacificum]|uniref:Uncharacterized protein n=1 Tax=Desulfurobacterium pacificum TaxID=240166 RepID=A0ABY1N9Q2_9BACT|nr:hypothetical protein SAMN06265339_0151 [Desulfurobacterium pacificum]